jgi:DNA-binding CsgD family transcriptional regulator
MPRDAKTGIQTIDINDETATSVLADPVNGGLFEVIRRFRKPATAAQLTEATGIPHAALMARIDALVAARLVRALRPRAPRKVHAYEAACQRIVIAFDTRDAAECAKALRLQAAATRDIEATLRRQPTDTLDGIPGTAWHRTRLKCRLRPDHLKGLGQRLHAVGEYIAQIAAEYPPEDPDSLTCNFVIGIDLVPVESRLLPSPPIAAVPRKAAAEVATNFGAGAMPEMSPREREVALALRDGLTREEIARKLGVSGNTIGTLMRRIYAKLGVHRRAELVTKLTGLGTSLTGENR